MVAHDDVPQLGFEVRLLGGVLFSTGVLTGLGYLLIPAVSLFLLDLLVASDRTAAPARFRAR